MTTTNTEPIDLTGLSAAEREAVLRDGTEAMRRRVAAILAKRAEVKRWVARYAPPHPGLDASEAD